MIGAGRIGELIGRGGSACGFRRQQHPMGRKLAAGSGSPGEATTAEL